jgi:hypothetical protein
MPDDVLERLFGELAGADLPVPPPARVVARGRRRRRRARGAFIAGAAAAVALLGLAVSELAGSHAPAQSPAARHNGAPAVCPAAPDPALTAQLQRALPTAGQTGLTVLTLSPDGSSAYVLTTANGFHGIAQESVATGDITRTIEALPASDDGALGGVTPDGDLVWFSLHSSFGGENGDTTPMQLWSPRTGTVTLLAPAGQTGGALSAPVFSDADHGLAAWEQADGSEREIVVANLRTGVTDVIARGQVLAPVFARDALVWPAGSPPAGQSSHLVAVRADRLPAVVSAAVPVPLRAAGQASLIASAGGQTAYFSADLTELFYSPGLAVPARLVLRLPSGETFGAEPPVLGPGYLGWGTAYAASYVASTSSLAAATLTDGNTTSGDVQAAGGFVIAASSPDPKQGSWRLSVLSGGTIARLACATSRPAGR